MVKTFLAISFAVLVGGAAAQQPKQPKQPKQPARGKYDPPAAMKPNAATMKIIAEKTEQLRQALAGLKAKKIPDEVLVEVEIYLKAAENIVRLEEWYAKQSGQWTLTTLDRGLERARQAEGGKAPWRDETGRWVVRAYRSYIDRSIQPYAVLLPHDFGKDPMKKWRLDIVLHGRDSSLTEAKFIATHDSSKLAPKDLDYVQLEPMGRGNNAYRWAGEADVFEASSKWQQSYISQSRFVIDLNRRVLRGFSMGGAGAWHIGLRHPTDFCVIGPGAGFTTTHGYVGGMPAKLPDYQEKCLRIYDAINYAENAFNVPIVAYSGEIDAQKKAADNIENALKQFKEPHQFTHLIAPGLAHQMPKDWQEKAELEYRKYADGSKPYWPERVRFITYTSRYGNTSPFAIEALENEYERALVDFTIENNRMIIKTENVRRLGINRRFPQKPFDVTLDGQEFKGLIFPNVGKPLPSFAKRDKKWIALNRVSNGPIPEVRIKDNWVSGPIDDAFTRRIIVAKPSPSDSPLTADRYAVAALEEFGRNWDRYFRGALPIGDPEAAPRPSSPNVRPTNWVLFGTPKSNPLIAKVLPKLPIVWTEDKLIVNGVEYDPKTHVPVLIYPNPLTNYRSYVVINSGHTFKEADFKGTNALLYPRLGDWAVLKPKPTAKDPAAYEVVAAGLFDADWQFPKKK